LHHQTSASIRTSYLALVIEKGWDSQLDT
jgi:hypothetical protein